MFGGIEFVMEKFLVMKIIFGKILQLNDRSQEMRLLLELIMEK